MRTSYSGAVVLSSILDTMGEASFSRWFLDMLRASDMDQAEFARRYQAVAGLAAAPTGRVSEWATGKAIPGDKSAALIAEVFRIDHEDVLSAAGRLIATEPLDPSDQRELVIQRLRRLPPEPVLLDSILGVIEAWEKNRKRKEGKGA